MKFKILNKISNLFVKSAIRNISINELSRSLNTNHNFFESPDITRTIQYYEQVSPVFTAIDILATEFAAIKPKVWNKKDMDFVTDHPILDLLQRPNPFVKGSLFLNILSSYFLITGNTFVSASIAGKTGEPLELFINDPRDVTIETGTDGFPSRYRLSSSFNGVDFDRTVFTSAAERDRFGSIRFIENDKREIWQIRRFNPAVSIKSGSGGFTRTFFGLSPLNSLFFEIEQYLKSNQHNLSLLNRGLKVSGVFSFKEALTDDQYERVTSKISDFYQGADNTGRPVVADGGADFKPITESIRDMDFNNLTRRVLERIFNTYKIPLPLISPDQMTLSNFETAKLSLYENSVIPLARRLYDELNCFLMPRYQNSQNLELTFDIGDITALQPKIVERMERLSKTNTLTINELRAMIGKENLEDGDQVFLPANLLPAFGDMFLNDNPESPRPRSLKKEFQKLLRQQVFDGDNAFTERDIEALSKKIYG